MGNDSDGSCIPAGALGTDSPMRVFLGGIPLGCDNIGDEAILACVVAMLRSDIPGVALTVATNDPETASRLGVDVVPAFGFAGVPADGFRKAVEGFDAYVWCGATGLSDYPDVALSLLEAAISAGVPSFVWGVGMDDELNPAFFRTHGRRRRVLRALGLNGAYERRLERRLSERVRRILPMCAGVWLRDCGSAARLAGLGFRDAAVGADTAVLQTAGGPDPAPEGCCGQERASEAGRLPPRVLGVCVSAQRQIADAAGFKAMLGRLADAGVDILGIPMNPRTDRALMEPLGIRCIEGTSPEAVVKAAASCGAVLSSRLHLLILAANAGTPGLGISRGSKIANWLANFGQTPVGSVGECDWHHVESAVLALLDSPQATWRQIRGAAYSRLIARLAAARAEFSAALRGAAPDGWPRVSVLVRARNDEAFMGRTLAAIFGQWPRPFEVLVCDDHSTDRTREIAAGFPVRFVDPPEGPYRPGATLNKLVRETAGDVVVFNNSDAIPQGRGWLRNLVLPLLGEDGRLTFAFANQVPRPDALLTVARDSERAFGDGTVQAKWRFFFSLASAAAWRDMLVARPFDEAIQYSEDVEWAWRNSRPADDPAKIAYRPGAMVEHSHNYTLRELARRFRGEGEADAAIFGDRPSLLRELAGAARETLRDWRWLIARPRGWREIPAAPFRRAVQRLAHWRGVACGAKAPSK